MEDSRVRVVELREEKLEVDETLWRGMASGVGGYGGRVLMGP